VDWRRAIAFVHDAPTILPMSTTILAHITGVVQGVGFRAWTQDEAQALGLSGWAKNEPDGSVTALFSGPNDKIAAMLEKLHRGPAGAHVKSVDLAGFRILR
jgi:acylphosphatase